MQNYDRKFGNEGYGTYGRGNYLQQLPTPQRIAFSDFSGGLDMRNSREDTPPNASPNSLDVEVTKQDSIRPVPGTTTVEVLTRDAKQVLLQASLDYTSELIMFDAPFIGVKRGDETVWFDAGLAVADRLFASVNFGGTLVFSNGNTGLFMRESGKDEVELIEHGPAAHSLASFAGRIFAGASIIGGNREPLGISWSGSSSDPEEWDAFTEEGAQTGAGSELLIDDMIQGNYIVALRTMGLDFMAIFMRNSIWIGRRTSQLLRPADFQPRVTGVGAVNEATCAVTRFGAVHLHDSGVYLFDGNNTILVSEQINRELLPLDMEQLNLYRAAYNPITKLYFLFTPVCTWVFDLEGRRWQKRSIIALGASIFAPQLPAKTWAELLGTWGAQTGTWEDYKAQELPGLEFLYLGEENEETVLAKEDAGSRANFSTAMEPFWETSLVPVGTRKRLVAIKEIVYSYEREGLLRFDFLLSSGEFGSGREVRLRRADALLTEFVRLERTVSRIGARIFFIEDFPEISHIEFEALASGSTRSSSPTVVFELNDTGLDYTGYFTDFSNYPAGATPTGWIQDVVNATLLSVIDDGGNNLLRISNVGVPGGGSLSGRWVWSVGGLLAASTDQTVEVAFRFRKSNRSNLASQWVGVVRSVLADTSKFVLTSLGVNSDKFRAFFGAGTLADEEPFVWNANEWLMVRQRVSGTLAATRVQARIWRTVEDTSSWMLDGTGAGSALGYAGVAHAFSLNVSSHVEYDWFGMAIGGGTAPTEAPRNGWILEIGKFNFRLIGLPSDYSVRAGGVTKAEIDGAVNFALVSAPVLIELLDSNDDVVASYSEAILDRHEYEVDLYYV
jgi:hypothetical protein